MGFHFAFDKMTVDLIAIHESILHVQFQFAYQDLHTKTCIPKFAYQNLIQFGLIPKGHFAFTASENETCALYKLGLCKVHQKLPKSIVTFKCANQIKVDFGSLLALAHIASAWKPLQHRVWTLLPQSKSQRVLPMLRSALRTKDQG